VTGLFDTLLVANRGEIAVRIMRTLRTMGIRSVAVYSEADRRAPYLAEADLAVAIGGPASYLDVERIVAAAVSSGAGGIHPGYGFLAENPDLSRRCAEVGIAFIGPPPEAIALMGDKIRAKATVAAAGVPVVPGGGAAGLTDAELAATATDIGLPVLLKPAAGGGGKGMRRVSDQAELLTAIAAARREAVGAFGDDTLLVERLVSPARHIEVQIFADGYGQVCSLGERECSLQRRHQKIVEESPCLFLDPATRSAMGAAAVEAARACGYVNAGTVEFILPADRLDDFYFMEMNTRIQVEHPVTEAVLGLDLVEWQVRVAAGERIPWAPTGPAPRGHAVEARVYAEDPRRGFLPATGTVLRLAEAGALDHVRVDSALQVGSVIGPDYDPMLAKVIAWGDDRPAALTRLGTALAATLVLGVTTNVGFLRRLVAHPDVVAGRLDTDLVEAIATEVAGPAAPADVVATAALLQPLLARPPGPTVDPWDLADGWRVNGQADTTSRWQVDGEVVDAVLANGGVAVGDGGPAEARADLVGDDVVVEVGGISTRYAFATDGDSLWLGRNGDGWHLTELRETVDHSRLSTSGAGTLRSPMPGTVLAVYVGPGETVRAGQPLMTVEAMKMEHVIAAPVDGSVGEILVKAGDSVRLDQALAVVNPPVPVS
jgi:acetyl-CoA/propionyl-CoA carboxylase biotin carboxyl carrier protein